MKQFTSSKSFTENCGSLLNCNFNMGELILNMAKDIHQFDSHILSAKNLEFFNKYNNSAVSFSMLNNFLHRAYNCGIQLNTRYGRVFNIASGISKTAICIDNGQCQFVIKYNHSAIEYSSNNGTFALPRLDKSISKSVQQQVLNQVATYDRLAHDTNIECHLLPPFRLYDRYNATVEPFASHVGNVEDIATMEEIRAFKILMRQYNIGDMHQGNYGYFNGKIVAIDYAL